MREPIMSIDELSSYMEEVFPERAGDFHIDALSSMHATISQEVGPLDLRPGGTVSGPTIFALADCAFYFATLAMIGRVALAVTTNLNLTFMRKAPMAPLRAEARILKLGKLLSQGDVLVFSEGSEQPVAQAAVTYAIPPMS